MLSGEYNILVDNMWLTDILSVILLILPFFLVFYDKKWVFCFYIISIVANLPLIFYMSFHFSYEMIIVLAIIISLIKDLIINKSLKYVTTKHSIHIILVLILLIIVNLLTSFFNFNKNEIITRTIIYGVNLFILFVFTYFLVNRQRIEILKNGFLIGSLILILSMIVEMYYGYYILKVANLRPAGLLLDPNVSAFALNISLIISFYKTRRNNIIGDLFIILMRVLIIFGIFLTVSRSAYISTVVILVMLLIYYSRGKNKWIAATTVIVLVIMYFALYNIISNFIKVIYQIIDLDRIFPTTIPTPPNNPGNPGNVIDQPDYSNSRITLIKAGIDVFLNNIIVGVGVGNVIDQINARTGLKMNSHNLLIQLIDESGILMLLVIILLAYYLIRLMLSSGKKSRFFVLLIGIIILIESMFNHNLLNVNIIWVVLAFLISITVIYSKEQKVFSISRETLSKNYRKKSQG